MLCPAGCCEHFRVLSSNPDIYSLDSSSIPIPQSMTIKNDSRNCQISPLGKKMIPSCEPLLSIYLLIYFLIYLAFVPLHFVFFFWTSVLRACYTWSVIYQKDRKLALRRSRLSFLYLTLAAWPGTTHTSSLSLSFFNHKMERLD